ADRSAEAGNRPRKFRGTRGALTRKLAAPRQLAEAAGVISMDPIRRPRIAAAGCARLPPTAAALPVAAPPLIARLLVPAAVRSVRLRRPAAAAALEAPHHRLEALLAAAMAEAVAVDSMAAAVDPMAV